jgi:hypothetical protein
VPNGKFEGKSYCEYLQSASTDEDRLIISMQNKAGEILRNMDTFSGQSDVHMVSLEDLSHDASGETYWIICQKMGLSDVDSATFYALLVRHALWNLKAQGKGIPGHSTSGVSSDSIRRIKGRALTCYQELFGDIHVRLGYGE